MYRSLPIKADYWHCFLPIREGVSEEMIRAEAYVESFLPIREGVSRTYARKSIYSLFPPYTGGCIGKEPGSRNSNFCFLPIREGVSALDQLAYSSSEFPPYTGGCIPVV